VEGGANQPSPFVASSFALRATADKTAGRHPTHEPEPSISAFPALLCGESPLQPHCKAGLACLVLYLSIGTPVPDRANVMQTHDKPRNAAAFTLVEILIVVAIIGLLAAIAIPSFAKARLESRVSSYLNSLRVAVDAFELYAMENSGYPPDRTPGQVPNGMDEYITRMNWTTRTPLGGRWDWDRNSVGITAGVTGIGSDLNLDGILLVDERIDDGNLLTGRFRRTGAGGYSYVIAD